VRRFVGALFLAALPSVFVVAGAAQQGWRDDTHGRNATPDYARVFPENIVKRLDIQIASADWERLRADMAEMVGASGVEGGGRQGGVPPDPLRGAACTGLVEGSVCQFGNPPIGGRCAQLPMGAGLSCTPLPGVFNPFPGGNPNPVPPPGMGGGGVGGAGGRDDVELLPRNPIYIPANLTFEGVVFRHVGLRLKGNSSLLNSWRSGVEKLPFRLNFDELEDRYPEIRDQTFFGFPNINLTNNSQDSSYLKAKVVGDLFREAGVPAARTAFVRVYLDRGAGMNYLGLYTFVEVPDEPMLSTLFGSGSGNLYKPAGTGGRWRLFVADDFPKKTNEDDEDWTDVQEAIAVLNEPRTNPAAWRARLEARFAVDGFLRWLAVNTVIGNTDTYGSFSPHNYYVYGSPRHRDRLFWIPWDHDLSLNANLGGGGNAGTGGAVLDLFHDRVDASWPLIRYLLDDPVYRTAYRRHVEDVLATVFDPGTLSSRLQTQHALIAPFVVGAEGEQPGRTFINTPAQFTQALSTVVSYVQGRAVAVRQALAASR
jgi:hypothetical protein